MISSNKDLQKLLSNVFHGSLSISLLPPPPTPKYLFLSNRTFPRMIFKVKLSIKFQVLLILLSHPNYFRNRDSFEVKLGLNSTFLPLKIPPLACSQLIAFYNTLFMFNEKKRIHSIRNLRYVASSGTSFINYKSDFNLSLQR